MTVAIKVENVSKYYRLGLIGGGTIRSDFSRWWARVRGKPDPLLKIGDVDHGNRQGEYIWALRDINFEVQRGEVIGLIGRNGAGKSTMLKILSRITAPTAGAIKVNGRIASLLEVGTGFHPELTGRENIYLNGTILGMRRHEIDRKLDEIIDFSGVEKYIDTPVKRYSSGMHVRLAFSVAAHLDPEILLVDEVLAVGDADFQKKCLGKMKDVSTSGRTILFVSHNMGSIIDLCPNSIFLERGMVKSIGPSDKIVAQYLEQNSSSGHINLLETQLSEVKEGRSRLLFVETLDENGVLCSMFSYGETIHVRLGIRGSVGMRALLGIGIRDVLGHEILHFNNKDDGLDVQIGDGRTVVEMRFQNILNKGDYWLYVWLGDMFMNAQDYANNVLRFSVDTTDRGSSLAQGAIIHPARWSIDS